MIKFLLLSALIFLNVSLAQVEIEDEEEDVDLDLLEEGHIERTEQENGVTIDKQKGTPEQANVVRQMIEKDERVRAERVQQVKDFKLPYEKWADDPSDYEMYKNKKFEKLGWTSDYTKFWYQKAPNVGMMSSTKYAQYVVNDYNGSFKGDNQTWVILIGTHVDNKTQDVALQMNILARKFKRAKKTTYRWDFIDYVVDERLAHSIGYRNSPSLYVIDGHDKMVYAWDLPHSTPIDNKTLGHWLKDRDYRQSDLKFEVPRLINSPTKMSQSKAMFWARKHIGWGFQNAMRSQPQFLKNLFAPILDHDGNDPLRLKADNLITISAYSFVIFIVLPTIYLILKFFLWMCSYTVIIEVDDQEWEELKKKGKVE